MLRTRFLNPFNVHVTNQEEMGVRRVAPWQKLFEGNLALPKIDRLRAAPSRRSERIKFFISPFFNSLHGFSRVHSLPVAARAAESTFVGQVLMTTTGRA